MSCLQQVRTHFFFQSLFVTRNTDAVIKNMSTIRKAESTQTIRLHDLILGSASRASHR
jgi:hypothetical protein